MVNFNNRTSNGMKKIVTHSGNFHTDEVFACAVLSILHDGNVEIARSREREVWVTGDYVVDVGGVYDAEVGRFDHHQEGGAGRRENGIPYSSLGLVWKHYGGQLCGSTEAARRIDEKLVQPVDAGDNGISLFTLTSLKIFPSLLHHTVTAFRPTWKEENIHKISFDAGFAQAMEVAKKIISREIIIACDQLEGEAIVSEIYHKSEDKRIIVIDGQHPWEWILTQYLEPLYVVKPDHENGGRWKVKAVRKNVDSFESRKLLPLAWAGKRDEELVAITGVLDARFCHNLRFIAGANNKEGALKLARIAVAA
ncbi:MAG: Metal-dependent protein hydrolase [Parcubacteria group bacterium GW2011_GWA1_47_8]|nr:hypothetical protein [uncultured bacterium]KKU81481.1 MAG: Metal-dependent protein hydrolase [Parcubacteria group bacterium GW2011_GWA1_47_8]